MKTTSDVIACVVDGGLFTELAIRLSRGMKKVYYQCTIDQPFPKVNEAIIGDGFDEIERINDFWPIKNEIDLFVFPDCSHAGLQNELVSQGYPVWGSRDGCDLELRRVAFKHLLKELGLMVGGYQVCRGVSELRSHLWDKEDKWVKMSKFRGTQETWHWANRETSSGELDRLACELGGVQDRIPFIVEDCIETEVEWGYDGYFCGGKFPSLSMHGPEIKDKSYLGAVVEWDDLPQQVREINLALATTLREAGYSNFWSAEIRITKDGDAYFTDPTCRCPWPAGMPQLEMYSNIAEIIWNGANGGCIDPKPAGRFAAEVMINHDGDEKAWRRLVVPDKIRQWTKLMWAAKVGDETYAFPPFSHSCDQVGSLIGLGDTLEGAIETVKEYAGEFKDQHVTINTDVLATGLKVLQEAEEGDVEFSGQKIPEPSTVLE